MFSKKLLVIGLAVSAAVGTNFAHAELSSFKSKMIDQKFADADTNHDGKLTLEEAKAGMPKVAENFDKIDSQHKGYVTLAQIKAAAEKD